MTKETGYVVFPISPAAIDDVEDSVCRKLWTGHEAECQRNGAEFYNFGWVTTENGICSKTSKGYLDSNINPETLELTHWWGD